MTRKDYVLLAQVFRAQIDTLELTFEPSEMSLALLVISQSIHRTATALRATNQAFDANRFIAATGILEKVAA